MRSAFVFLIIVAAFVSGCDDGFTLPPISWEGNNILFGTTYDQLPCGDTLEILDNEVSRLDNEFHFQIREEKITYYWLKEGELAQVCSGAEHGGCTDGGHTVYDTGPFHQHELTHAVLSSLGRSHPALEEGFAEGWEWNQIAPEYPCDLPSIPCEAGVELLQSYFYDPPSNRSKMDYQYLSHFVRYLVSAYGMEEVLSVYQDAALDSSYEDLQAIFENHLGDSLDQSLEGWRDSAPSCYPSAMGCSNTNIEQINDGIWYQDVTFKCGGEDPLVHHAHNALQLFLNFEAPEDGIYMLAANTSSPDLDWSIQLYGCTDCRYWEAFSNEEEKEIELVTGTYQVILWGFWYPFEIDDWLELTINKQ